MVGLTMIVVDVVAAGKERSCMCGEAFVVLRF